MTDEEVKRTHDDLEIMRRPHLWPIQMFLPLKKPVPHQFPLMGVLVHLDQPGRYKFLRDHNMLVPPAPDANWEDCDDAMLVKLCQEGWIVD